MLISQLESVGQATGGLMDELIMTSGMRGVIDPSIMTLQQSVEFESLLPQLFH